MIEERLFIGDVLVSIRIHHGMIDKEETHIIKPHNIEGVYFFETIAGQIIADKDSKAKLVYTPIKRSNQNE